MPWKLRGVCRDGEVKVDSKEHQVKVGKGCGKSHEARNATNYFPLSRYHGARALLPPMLSPFITDELDVHRLNKTLDFLKIYDIMLL